MAQESLRTIRGTEELATVSGNIVKLYCLVRDRCRIPAEQPSNVVLMRLEQVFENLDRLAQKHFPFPGREWSSPLGILGKADDAFQAAEAARRNLEQANRKLREELDSRRQSQEV